MKENDRCLSKRMDNRQTSKNHGFSSSVPPDERRVEGPMIGTIVFFLLRRVLRRPRSLVFDVAGGVRDYRYLDHAQMHCGIVSREIRSRTIPLRRRVCLPTQEQRFNSLCFG